MQKISWWETWLDDDMSWRERSALNSAADGIAGLQDNDIPRALDTREIPGVTAEYAQATRHALAAGFDGVELNSASGYLPMQFLSTGSTQPPGRRRASVSRSVRRFRSTTFRTTTRRRPTRRWRGRFRRWDSPICT